MSANWVDLFYIVGISSRPVDLDGEIKSSIQYVYAYVSANVRAHVRACVSVWVCVIDSRLPFYSPSSVSIVHIRSRMNNMTG